MHKSVYTSRLQ